MNDATSNFAEKPARSSKAASSASAGTSCATVTCGIWEDAADRGYGARETLPGMGLIIAVTENGEELLRANGR